MRVLLSRSFLSAALFALTAAGATTVSAQPPRSGGFDFTYGTGSANPNGEYVDLKGSLAVAEALVSTRLDGGFTPFLMGLQFFYFEHEKGDGVCVVSALTPPCVRKFPHVAGAAFLFAFEPRFFGNTFTQLNVGLGPIQPSSAGGPNFAATSAIKVGVGIGRHFAVMGGFRYLISPDFRGESASISTSTFGIRIR